MLSWRLGVGTQYPPRLSLVLINRPQTGWHAELALVRSSARVTFEQAITSPALYHTATNAPTPTQAATFNSEDMQQQFKKK